MENFERLLLYFYVLEHGAKDAGDQLKKFGQISGLSEPQVQIALDKCVLLGFADKD